jgi:hypothetical protein
VRELVAQKNETGNPWTGPVALDRQLLRSVFDEDFNPVSSAAQGKVTAECDLVLDHWLEPLVLPSFDFVGKKTIYETPTKVKPDQIDLQTFYLDSSSPAKSAVMDERHEIPIERISLDEPRILVNNSTDRLTSVLSRPVAKKYALKLNEDEVNQDCVIDHSPLELEAAPAKPSKKDKKSKKEKKEKKRAKDKGRQSILDTLNFGKYSVWQGSEFYVELTLKEHPMDILEILSFEIEFFLTIHGNSKPRSKFSISVADQSIKTEVMKDYAVVSMTLKRQTTLDWFGGAVQAAIIFEGNSHEVHFEIPFSVNVLLPNHLLVASMTPQKYMEALQNPPAGPFTAVGTTTLLPPVTIQISQAIEKISGQISCIIVERHPGVVSLFGQTCTGVPIFGLLKEKRNKAGRPCLSLDIKTTHTMVLEWIMETLSSLSSDWLET